jgi:hypothetical protein
MIPLLVIYRANKRHYIDLGLKHIKEKGRPIGRPFSYDCSLE